MSEDLLPLAARGFAGGDLILDVGANEGEFALAMAQNHPQIPVLAFEPIPSLAAAIRERAASLGLRNLTCLELAIDEAPRMATFHVADHYDRGVSSLLTFDRTGIDQNDYWRDRPDLHFTNDLQVQVCRLDALLQPEPPARIRFIKVDAQGVDLNVLRSLGGLLARVDAGMLEVPATRLTRLYAEEDVDLLAALLFLRESGFDVHALKPNDPAANEFNVLFHRRGEDWRGMERALKLRGLHLYDGKHFWHLPSSRLLHPEAELAAVPRLQQAEAELRQQNAALHGDVEALRQEINQLRAAEVAQHHKTDALHQDVANSLEACARGYAAALETQREVSRLETAKDHLQSANAGLRATLEDARQQLDVLRRDAAAAHQDAAAAHRNAGEAHRNAEDARRDAGEARADAAYARRDAGEARQAMAHAQAETQQVLERMAALHRSSSWRLTGPLRRLTRLVRR